jgi:predicted GNAT superfamily acetyltransferase
VIHPLDTSIVIEKIDSFEGMDSCVHLQQSVWQFGDIDVIPRRMFVVARAVGGQIFGAWAGNNLVGFALAIPGIRNGQSYLHSHMLAVSLEYRNRGIGRLLKLAQRQDALTRGIDLIEWTFDPLQGKNAFFNIEKLGAIVRRYSPDFYGTSTSPMHGSLPTDRLHAEWWVKSERVTELIAGRSLPKYEIQETVTVTDKQSVLDATFHASQFSAVELLLLVRQQFLQAFSGGLMVLRFHTVPGGTACYLLGAPDEGTLDWK